MDIPNTQELKQTAARQTAGAPQQKRIILIYSGLTMGLSLLVLLVRYVLGLQIDQFGGLSNLGTRAMLASIQSALPLLQTLALMCLDLGYLAAMLRVARGQYASPNTLRLGFDRFWVLMRCALLQGLIYCGLAVAAVYAAAILFMLSPWSGAFVEQAAPLLADVSLLNPQMVIDESAAMALLPSMVPMFVLVGICLLVLLVPVAYRFRMAGYVLIDKPGRGAMFAIRESRKMMKGSRIRLFKLDVSLWWWYAISIAATALAYGDSLLLLLGISLPVSAEVSYFVFYALYLLAQFAACYFLRNRVEVVYAQVYNALKPRETDNGVVLGNIFQM